MAATEIRVFAAGAIVLAALALSACGAGTPKGDANSDASKPAKETPAASDDGGFKGKTVSGTGEYKIGTDLPYGGYQLKGELSSQPDGCTWSIKDADGAAFVENQGSYVFVTDVREAVTFVTNGCPDWEQFED